ncbi:hypothetical protein [Arthrobacter sp. UYCu712]|uniref:hypothetical protein n=1 Tax=Arthrobacter sp. UYCu712 TaxID=3156340 RepID=UPI00339B09DC
MTTAAKTLDGWGAWMERTGLALLDMGAPFAPARTAVVDNGSEAEASDLNGYSIVEAEDLQAARTLADGHPFLTDGNGKFTLEIFELAEM